MTYILCISPRNPHIGKIYSTVKRKIFDHKMQLAVNDARKKSDILIRGRFFINVLES